MSKTKATHQDLTDYEGVTDTGNPHAKRPADKDVKGDQTADTSAAKPVTTMPFQKVAEDVAALFAGVEGLSENFGALAAEKITAALEAHSETIRESVEAEYAEKFDAALMEATEELAERVDSYLTLGVKNYIKENAVAIEAGIKNDISEQILESVSNIIETAGVVLPADKVDIAEELATELAEMETRLDGKIEENISLRSDLLAEQVKFVGLELTEGMTDVSRARFISLQETISYGDVDEFRTKMSTLKESFAAEPLAESVKNDGLKDLVESMQPEIVVLEEDENKNKKPEGGFSRYL